MKLQSLKTVEVLNSNTLELITGGLVDSGSKKKDVTSDTNDSISSDIN